MPSGDPNISVPPLVICKRALRCSYLVVKCLIIGIILLFFCKYLLHQLTKNNSDDRTENSGELDQLASQSWDNLIIRYQYLHLFETGYPLGSSC